MSQESAQSVLLTVMNVKIKFPALFVRVVMCPIMMGDARSSLKELVAHSNNKVSLFSVYRDVYPAHSNKSATNARTADI